MDYQQAYDQMISHMRTQGCRSKSENGICLYRGPNNTKCAIGALIPDDKYDPSFEEIGVVDIQVSALEDYSPEFLQSAQNLLHDDISDPSDIFIDVHPSQFHHLLEKNAKTFCEKFNLTYTPTEESQ